MIDSWSFLWGIKIARSANAAFGVLGGNGSGNIPISYGRSKGSLDFSEVSTPYVDTCPDVISVCSTDHPFTFSSDYILSSRHLAMNTKTPFSLRVAHKCYRLIQATKTLQEGDGYLQFGLYYGPSKTAAGSTDYTEPSYQERRLSPGYSLSQYTANAGFPSAWTPNSTLLQSGDTTILFYFVGGVGMTKISSDAIFATQSAPLVAGA
jgi:hypothetical protein